MIISIGLYTIALTQKCFSTDGQIESRGISLFIFGLLGFLGGESAAWLCWLANPLMYIAWVKFTSKPKISLLTSIAAVFICLMFLKVDQIIADESGNNFRNITGYNIGYWLWLSSAYAMLFGNLLVYIQNKRLKLSNN